MNEPAAVCYICGVLKYLDHMVYALHQAKICATCYDVFLRTREHKAVR